MKLNESKGVQNSTLPNDWHNNMPKKMYLQYFSTLSHERNDFCKKAIEQICVLIFSTFFFSEKFLILRRTDKDMIKNVY
jgi:hypothetical protein